MPLIVAPNAADNARLCAVIGCPVNTALTTFEPTPVMAPFLSAAVRVRAGSKNWLAAPPVMAPVTAAVNTELRLISPVVANCVSAFIPALDKPPYVTAPLNVCATPGPMTPV